MGTNFYTLLFFLAGHEGGVLAVGDVHRGSPGGHAGGGAGAPVPPLRRDFRPNFGRRPEHEQFRRVERRQHRDNFTAIPIREPAGRREPLREPSRRKGESGRSPRPCPSSIREPGSQASPCRTTRNSGPPSSFGTRPTSWRQPVVMTTAFIYGMLGKGTSDNGLQVSVRCRRTKDSVSHRRKDGGLSRCWPSSGWYSSCRDLKHYHPTMEPENYSPYQLSQGHLQHVLHAGGRWHCMSVTMQPT